MADSGQTTTPGINIDVGGKKVTASDASVTTVTQALERMWGRGLDWCGDHPSQFFGLLIVLLAIVLIKRRTQLDAVHLQNQYDHHRDIVRASLPKKEMPEPPMPSKDQQQ